MDPAVGCTGSRHCLTNVPYFQADRKQRCKWPHSASSTCNREEGTEGIRYTFTRHVAEVTIGSNRASGHLLDEIDTIC